MTTSVSTAKVIQKLLHMKLRNCENIQSAYNISRSKYKDNLVNQKTFELAPKKEAYGLKHQNEDYVYVLCELKVERRCKCDKHRQASLETKSYIKVLHDSY